MVFHFLIHYAWNPGHTVSFLFHCFLTWAPLPPFAMVFVHNPCSSGDHRRLPETSKLLVMRMSQNNESGKAIALFFFCSTTGWFLWRSKEVLATMTPGYVLIRTYHTLTKYMVKHCLSWRMVSLNREYRRKRSGSYMLSSHRGQTSGGKTDHCSLRSYDQCSSRGKIAFTPLFPFFLCSPCSVMENCSCLLVSGHALGWQRRQIHCRVQSRSLWDGVIKYTCLYITC